MEDKLEAAFKEYMARKSGEKKPLGVAEWSGSKARFIIDDAERCVCCMSVSEAMLYSHTFSVKHIANLFGVSVNSLNKRIKEETEYASG
jgi:hypothetical protein